MLFRACIVDLDFNAFLQQFQLHYAVSKGINGRLRQHGAYIQLVTLFAVVSDPHEFFGGNLGEN